MSVFSTLCVFLCVRVRICMRTCVRVYIYVYVYTLYIYVTENEKIAHVLSMIESLIYVPVRSMMLVEQCVKISYRNDVF